MYRYAILALLVATSADDVNLRYAQLKLESAELNLEKMQNLQTLVPTETLADYVREVQIGRTRLDVTERGGKDFFLVWLKRAEVAARSAQVQYQKALQINQKAPGTTSEYDLERLRLSAEIAVLEYEKGRRLLNAPTDQQYRWQISYLDSQVQKLNDEVFRKVKN
jgi:hypothetical protein